MRIIRRILTGTVAVGALATIAPAAMAADGLVHAYEHPYQGGRHASWGGNDSDWSTSNGGNMRNQASSLYNSGYSAYTNKHVNFYYSPGYGGSWACLGNGDYWADLTLRRESFSYGSTRPGYGQPLENNIASHRWVAYCGAP